MSTVWGSVNSEKGNGEREGERSRDSQTESGRIARRRYQISGTFLDLEPEALVEISHNNPQLGTEFTLSIRKSSSFRNVSVMTLK